MTGNSQRPGLKLLALWRGRLVPRTRSSHHIAARVFANFGFKSGTRIIGFSSVPLIPRFASSVPQGWANLGIGTLGGSCIDIVTRTTNVRRDQQKHREEPS